MRGRLVAMSVALIGRTCHSFGRSCCRGVAGEHPARFCDKTATTESGPPRNGIGPFARWRDAFRRVRQEVSSYAYSAGEDLEGDQAVIRWRHWSWTVSAGCVGGCPNGLGVARPAGGAASLSVLDPGEHGYRRAVAVRAGCGRDCLGCGNGGQPRAARRSAEWAGLHGRRAVRFGRSRHSLRHGRWNAPDGKRAPCATSSIVRPDGYPNRCGKIGCE